MQTTEQKSIYYLGRSDNYPFMMSVESVKKDDEFKKIIQVEHARQPPEAKTMSGTCRRGSRRMRMHQQDSRWAWVVCFSAFASNVISLGCPYGFGVFLPSLLAHFKEGKALTAWVGSLTMGLIFFLGPVAGKLIERFGCRITAIFGALLNALGLFLTSFVTSLPLMFLTFSLLCGMGTSCVYTSSFVIVPRYFRTNRSLAVGIISSGLPCGLLTVTAVGNALLEIYGWGDVFKIMSGVALGVCLLALTFDPNVDDTHEVTETANGRTRKTMFDFSVLKSKRYVVFLAAAMVSYVASNIPVIHLVKFAKEVGVADHKASWPLFCVGLGSFLVRPVVGRLCDLSFVNTQYMFQCFLFLAGLAVVLSALASSVAGLVAYGFSYGVLLGGYQIALFLLVLTSLSPRNRTQGFGFFLFSISFSLAGGAPLGGFIADNTDSYKMAFYVTGIFYFVSCVIPFCLRCWKHDKAYKESGEDGELFVLENNIPVQYVSTC